MANIYVERIRNPKYPLLGEMPLQPHHNKNVIVLWSMLQAPNSCERHFRKSKAQIGIEF